MGALVMLIGMSAASAGTAASINEPIAPATRDLFMAEISTRMRALHCKPEMQEQRVVAAGTDGGAVELVVERVVERNARVEPWPARRLAGPERDIGDLGDPAVAVG